MKNAGFLLCPLCKTPMRPVRAERHYSGHHDLGQCVHCGGLWFDAMELFGVKHGQGEKIDRVDIRSFCEHTSTSTAPLKCPRDHSVLTVLKDQNFPGELIIEHCKNCSGYWLNRGEFHSYQKARAAMMSEGAKKKSDDELIKSIDRLLTLQSSHGTAEALGRISKGLMTPVYGRGGMIYDGFSVDDKKSREIAGRAIGILGLVIRLAARFLAR